MFKDPDVSLTSAELAISVLFSLETVLEMRPIIHNSNLI